MSSESGTRSPKRSTTRSAVISSVYRSARTYPSATSLSDRTFTRPKSAHARVGVVESVDHCIALLAKGVHLVEVLVVVRECCIDLLARERRVALANVLGRLFSLANALTDHEHSDARSLDARLSV